MSHFSANTDPASNNANAPNALVDANSPNQSHPIQGNGAVNSVAPDTLGASAQSAQPASSTAPNLTTSVPVQASIAPATLSSATSASSANTPAPRTTRRIAPGFTTPVSVNSFSATAGPGGNDTLRNLTANSPAQARSHTQPPSEINTINLSPFRAIAPSLMIRPSPDESVQPHFVVHTASFLGLANENTVDRIRVSTSTEFRTYRFGNWDDAHRFYAAVYRAGTLRLAPTEESINILAAMYGGRPMISDREGLAPESIFRDPWLAAATALAMATPYLNPTASPSSNPYCARCGAAMGVRPQPSSILPDSFFNPASPSPGVLTPGSSGQSGPARQFVTFAEPVQTNRRERQAVPAVPASAPVPVPAAVPAPAPGPVPAPAPARPHSTAPTPALTRHRHRPIAPAPHRPVAPNPLHAQPLASAHSGQPATPTPTSRATGPLPIRRSSDVIEISDDDAPGHPQKKPRTSGPVAAPLPGSQPRDPFAQGSSLRRKAGRGASSASSLRRPTERQFLDHLNRAMRAEMAFRRMGNKPNDPDALSPPSTGSSSSSSTPSSSPSAGNVPGSSGAPCSGVPPSTCGARSSVSNTNGASVASSDAATSTSAARVHPTANQQRQPMTNYLNVLIQAAAALAGQAGPSTTNPAPANPVPANPTSVNPATVNSAPANPAPIITPALITPALVNPVPTNVNLTQPAGANANVNAVPSSPSETDFSEVDREELEKTMRQYD